MKCKFLSGPKSGEIAHLRNDVGYPLAAAGLVEIIDGRSPDSITLDMVREANVNNPPDLEPRWSVELIGGRDAKFPQVALVLRVLNSVYSYVGDPKTINETRSFSDGTGVHYISGFGREVPQQYIDAYARGKKIGPLDEEALAKMNEEAHAARRRWLVEQGLADPPRLTDIPPGERGPFRRK